MTLTDDGAQTVRLEEAEARIVALLLDALDTLARIVVAGEAATPSGVDLDAVERPRVRLAIDEAAGIVALAARLPDGTVRRLQGYSIDGVRAHLARLAQAAQADAAGQHQWH